MRKLLPLLIGMALGSFSSLAAADDLAQVYNQAKENDPQLLRAAATKDAAFEAVNSSQSSLLPQIDLTAGYNIVRSDLDRNENDRLTAGISLSQELYQQSSWVSLDIAEKSARQADSAYAAEQQGVILRVAQAYFDVLRANDSLEFVRAEKAAVGRQLEQTKQRFDVGLSAITDVHDAQAQYDSVLANEVLTENQLVNSYEDLRVITGQGHTKLSVLDTERFSASPSAQSSDSLIDEAQQKNLSLLAARISADVAKDNISLASSGHMPSLTFDAGYKYTDQSGTYNNGSNDYDSSDINAGINLYIPLYSGGNTSSLTSQAEFQYVAASQDLEATYRDVTKNVRAYNNNINASIGALKAYEQTVISAKSALEATEAGFDVGTRTIVDVLDSTRRLYDANRNLANARYDYILSVLQLKQAVGTLSEQDIMDINAGLKANKTTQAK
ncbi:MULTISPECIES: outer membrane channel protein TolC [Aliivibrio]|uniref:Outer membrane channel protein TolC n=1 Tax=Aliivibrio finisterrensis TaxID=511998 RepID=A0A4Q5KXY4_9GAMM|nr:MULTISPECIES: outer membrane channel protein TolC [Aliivibrio]MDD9178232.1 outer membrane channel protein TolC [Aliivibrio sp. A6]RYU52653.1 outer membrane channel protein TolC [Aliivibrio finisterrensis]RYU55818.1 outer membrane channel protein TolC [Aliivibrio finisterrensis]RYU60658.1 outer membrane channel protein TolC [Aliivibrio finisterrensis]RYU66305.1 outer membrane channel protein TolC [Aliivibrio finisterrensis]